MRLLRIPSSPLISSTPGNVTSRPLQSPLQPFTLRTVNHDATLIHGSLDTRIFSLRITHIPKATQTEFPSFGTQYTHLSKRILRSQTFMGAFFLVLEGPLSGDTHPSTLHRINPAVHHQIFLLQPLFPLLSFFFFTHRNPRHHHHVAEFRLLPVSQASLS